MFLNLVKSFDRSRFDITLIVLIKPTNEHFVIYLPTDIAIRQYNFKRTIQSFFPLLFLIRNEKPDVVFSTLTHLNFILGIVKFFVSKKTHFVARESSIISLSIEDEKFPSLFKFFYRRVYDNINLVICQSKIMADDLIRNFKIRESATKVIYNPVDLNLISSSIQASSVPRKEKNEIQLLCVGRLYSVKGYDRLLSALSLLTDFNFTLKILGDGPEKGSLRNLVTDLNLNDNVNFLGIQENPFQFMAQADCLLLTSYYEGLPNVVLEANACGLPVIAFNAPGGIVEIIVEGLNGWLVKDGDLKAFAEKVRAKEYLFADRQKIKEFVTEKFSLNKIARQYEEAILSLQKSHD